MPAPYPQDWQALFTPVDIASLAVFRIGFGLLMVWECFQYLENGAVKALLRASMPTPAASVDCRTDLSVE